MSFLISDALADTAATTAAATNAAPGSSMPSLLLMGALIIVLYFVMIRPQAKRAKDHRNLISNLTKGDEVTTTGGLMGKISNITDDFIVLMIANNIEVTIQKGAILNVLPKGTLKLA